MAGTRNWLPTSRDAILAMAKTWLVLIAANLQKWGIPDSISQNLTALTASAESALEATKSDSTRTPVATALCRETFDALVLQMRELKRRYFFVPPLANTDIVALGLTPHNSSPSPSGPPTAQVTVETYLVGRHEMGVKIVYVTGNPNDSANKGYRIWYTVVAPGEVQPASPEDLRKSFFSQRKKNVIQFEYADSGKTVFIAVQIESGGGKKGAWGPMVSAVIP